jgi:dienelactone hydrolase
MELVQTWTTDGVRLDGEFQAPPSTSLSQIAVDACCLVHGTGGNFYSSGLFDAIAERLLQLGCAVLRVNTRGHDGISTAVTAKGGQRQGAAYELVDDCRKDLAAWTVWLSERCGPRIGLVGHSLGAVKSLYALAHDPQITCRRVVALSPPRLSYSWFCSSPEGTAFLETFTAAQKWVQDGQADKLLEVKLPLPIAISAGGYVEKYGPDERYNFLKFIAGVQCPVLVTLGSVEVANNMAFRELPGALAELKRRHGRLTVATIPGGDHFYSGVRAELIAQLEPWLSGD